MTNLSRLVLAFAVSFAACDTTAEVDSFYEQVPAEPELSEDERALLPEGTEHEHAEELDDLLAIEEAQDDGAAFDDDAIEGFVDIDVIDNDDAPSVVPSIPHAALLKWGLHPRASDAMRAAGLPSWRIMQTIGNAAASAGTHAQDGTVNGAPYSAATDISTSGLTTTQIHNLLEKLAKVGFAVWYRKSGADGWSGVNHMHAIYANSKMKSSLRSQVRAWLAGRNGLVSNTTYRFHTFSSAAKAAVKGKYAMSNSGLSNGGGGVSGRVNTDGTPLNVRANASKSAAIVGSIPDGAYITIACQKTGSTMTGTYGTTSLWDKTNGGFVSDAYVATGSDGRVAPNCN